MIPKSFKPFLWSYKVEDLDLQKNKSIIIGSILNLGGRDAVKDMFKIYSKQEILEVLNKQKISIFNKKSYNFWKKVL